MEYEAVDIETEKGPVWIPREVEIWEQNEDRQYDDSHKPSTTDELIANNLDKIFRTIHRVYYGGTSLGKCTFITSRI